ncbi:MAG: metal ABC transporter permease [Gallionella sp.]|nr:metal ABC transporter permease [Gallionella sp.]
MNATDLSIFLPAFIAGILILATHVPLGMKVLQRGIIFADLAVAQIAGLGVIAAGMLGAAEYPLAVQVIAATSALLGGAMLAYIERRHIDIQEAVIGLLFVLAATGGILLMSRDVHAGEHLQDLLVGQILWVTQPQLIATAMLSAALLAGWPLFKRYIGPSGFYAAFALAVTASVQLVGVYLVFASLIVPALATHRLKRRRLPAAFAVGIAGYGAGLLLSIWFDLPAGAAIVWAMALCGLAAGVLKRAD